MHVKWKMTAAPALALSACLVAVSAHAQIGDPGAARSLIYERCIACHRVPGFESVSPTPAVRAPDFQTIADDPGTYTDAYLKEFLCTPHFPMEKFIMSESDIDNVIAFFHALRGRPESR